MRGHTEFDSTYHFILVCKNARRNTNQFTEDMKIMLSKKKKITIRSGRVAKKRQKDETETGLSELYRACIRRTTEKNV